MYVVVYHGLEIGVSGIYGPYPTRSAASFAASMVQKRGGTWTIEKLRSVDFLEN